MNINSIQTFTFQETFNCSICLSDFLTGEGHQVDNNISHIFCRACLQQWLAMHNSCPSCRVLLTERVTIIFNDRDVEAPIAIQIANREFLRLVACSIAGAVIFSGLVASGILR
jgi:hypothetical protein